MKPIDKERQARLVVSERLRLYFTQLREGLAAGTEEVWKRVEATLNRDKNSAEVPHRVSLADSQKQGEVKRVHHSDSSCPDISQPPLPLKNQ